MLLLGRHVETVGQTTEKQPGLLGRTAKLYVSVTQGTNKSRGISSLVAFSWGERASRSGHAVCDLAPQRSELQRKALPNSTTASAN